MTASIFPKTALFTQYNARIRIRERMHGGIPKDPKVIEGWLRAKAGITQEEEVRRMMLETLRDLGAELSATPTDEEILEASQQLAAVKSTNGFKVDANGLYIEDRQVKAMLKEAVSVCFPYPDYKLTMSQARTKTGQGKAPWKYVAETVFVEPGHISLGRLGPDGADLTIQHLDGPGGPRSALSYFEYVEGVELEFQVLVARDSIPHDWWPQIWVHAQESGLGANRSQSLGRFDVTEWEEVKG